MALRQAALKVGLEGLRFLFAPAVDQPIVSIPTPREVRVSPRHPEIERIVQKSVRQNWANHTALWRTAASLSSCSIFLYHGRCQPSFDVQQCPFTRHMSPKGPQKKLMVDVVEQTLDVKL